MKRFYKTVTTAPASGGFQILLDGKPIKTPARASLVLPSQALAEAVADEWRNQTETIAPQEMVLTRLANTAIDKVGPGRSAIIDELVHFGRHDLLCYRAVEPDELFARECAAWDPLLAWLESAHNVALVTGRGLGALEQPAGALVAFEAMLEARDPFELAALRAAANVTGSLVLALALSADRIDAQRALAAADVEATYQAEKWGLDSEAEKRSRVLASELEAAGIFMRLART